MKVVRTEYSIYHGQLLNFGVRENIRQNTCATFSMRYIRNTTRKSLRLQHVHAPKAPLQIA